MLMFCPKCCKEVPTRKHGFRLLSGGVKRQIYQCLECHTMISGSIVPKGTMTTK
jgi:RNase P subunit RPR2